MLAQRILDESHSERIEICRLEVTPIPAENVVHALIFGP